jgi:hypothetical protein
MKNTPEGWRIVRTDRLTTLLQVAAKEVREGVAEIDIAEDRDEVRITVRNEVYRPASG